jgi:hypothetical protein
MDVINLRVIPLEVNLEIMAGIIWGMSPIVPHVLL